MEFIASLTLRSHPPEAIRWWALRYSHPPRQDEEDSHGKYLPFFAHVTYRFWYLVIVLTTKWASGWCVTTNSTATMKKSTAALEIKLSSASAKNYLTWNTTMFVTLCCLWVDTKHMRITISLTMKKNRLITMRSSETPMPRSISEMMNLRDLFNY